MTIKVVVAGNTAEYTEVWRSRFAQALPDMQVIGWSDGLGSIQADYAAVWKPPCRFFNQVTGLKAVFNLGAGVDSLMAMPDLPPGLDVVRIEDAGMSRQMAEYVLHGLSHVSRQFDQYSNFQAQRQWRPLPAINYEAWPVGVMGLGAIGRQVAETIASAGYPVSAWSRGRKAAGAIRTYYGEGDFQAFLSGTRVLVNVLPLTPATENIVNKQTLQALLPGAYLINVARGSHVVDDDLLAAIEAGHVQGALLDVFRTEPLPESHPYWRCPQVRVTPHIAAITRYEESLQQITDKIGLLEQGLPVTGIVARDRGY